VHVYVGSGRCIGPNDLIFFPAKIELRPDLVVDFSTGNTLESSTSNTLKSRNLAKKCAQKSENPHFSSSDLLPPEISDGPKFSFLGKYGVPASFCTVNQLRSSKTRDSRIRRSWRILTKIYAISGILEFGILSHFVKIRQLRRIREFRVLLLCS